MYPTLPFGPMSLPTGPILTIFAVVFGLEAAGRYGRKLGLSPDDVWNTGLIGTAAGLIVARLWNVFQFWSIYRTEPMLVLSIRPSGFEFWSGIVAAIIGGYLYLLHRALDPLRVGAALSIGALVGGALLSVSGHLTGSVLGIPSSMPWALSYFGEPRHPTGLYQAIGMLLLAAFLWLRSDPERAGRTILMAILGYSLLRLFLDGFSDGMELFGAYRISQVTALVTALGCVLLLARSASARTADVT